MDIYVEATKDLKCFEMKALMNISTSKKLLNLA